MATFNNDGEDYFRQKQAEYGEQLRRTWDWSVEVTKKGNDEIARVAEEFRGVHSSNLDKQRKLDQTIEDHMNGLYDKVMGLQQETDEKYNRLQGVLDEMDDPFQVEVGGTSGDRAQLERLYSEF